MDYTDDDRDQIGRFPDELGVEKLLRNRWALAQGSIDEECEKVIGLIVERWAFAVRPDIYSRVFFEKVFDDDVVYAGFWCELLDMCDRALFRGIATSTATDECAALLARVCHEKGIGKARLFIDGPLEILAEEFADALFAEHRELAHGDTYKILSPAALTGVLEILNHYEGAHME